MIKHIRTFENGDPIKASSISSTTQIRQQIAIDLVQGTHGKTNDFNYCLYKYIHKSNERLLLWNLLFFQSSSFASPYMVIFMGRSSNIGKPYKVHHNYHYGLAELSSIDNDEVVDRLWKDIV